MSERDDERGKRSQREEEIGSKREDEWERMSKSLRVKRL
jgi:hypothetical protein